MNLLKHGKGAISRVNRVFIFKAVSPCMNIYSCTFAVILLDMKIFLTGFMGSGKTYWGKIWARQSGLSFYDLDEEIEKETGKTIAWLFEKKGEAYFRETETGALHTFAEKEDCIIACGGGTACYNDNMQWINKNGISVYLSATPRYIFDRITGEKDRRPLISKINTADMLYYIEQKLKEREPFYKQAAFILQADELNENSLSTLNLKP